MFGVTAFGMQLPDMPITEPVLFFAVVALVFLVVPLLFERLRVPGLIGLLVAGAVLGPSGVGILARDAGTLLLGTVSGYQNDTSGNLVVTGDPVEILVYRCNT